MENADDLLQPSLSATESLATGIYPTRVGYLAAFFGGPLAGATIALLNSYRLKRLATDWPLGLAAVAMTVGLNWWEIRSGGRAWVAGHLGSEGVGLVLRLAGLALFAVVYSLHRQYYRHMALLGIEAPSGWLPGIASVAGSICVTIALRVALR